MLGWPLQKTAVAALAPEDLSLREEGQEVEVLSVEPLTASPGAADLTLA